MSVSEVAIALPFRLDAQGNVATSTDQAKLWADRLKAAIGTIRGTRLLRSGFGTGVTDGFLDTTTAMDSVLHDEIVKIFVSQFPTLTLIDVSVDWDSDANTMTADVLYRLPSQEESQTQVGIAYLANDNLLSEVNL